MFALDLKYLLDDDKTIRNQPAQNSFLFYQ